MIYLPPKDIVSGDFIGLMNQTIKFFAKQLIALGMEFGAMMSVIGLKLLNQAVQDKKARCAC